MWIVFIWFRLGSDVGCSEAFGLIKHGKFLDQLRDCHVLKNDSGTIGK
jgi:hypothetical protein